MTIKAGMQAISSEELLAQIKAWVDMVDEAVNRLVDHVEAYHRGLGLDVERRAGYGGRGDKLVVHAPWGDRLQKGILVIAHLDTVHKLGTLAQFPLRRDGERLYGPGVYDMKSGGCMAVEAMRSLLGSGAAPHLPLTLLFTPDEEIGSQTSRDIIAELAETAKYVLVPEGAHADGAIITGRKGSLKFDLNVKGRPAHSGTDHRDGRSAIVELAHQIIAIEAKTDYDRNITVNVGIVSGGGKQNVVPAHATARVDIRIAEPQQVDEILAMVAEIRPVTPDTTVEFVGGVWRRPFGETPAVAAFYEQARRIAADIGFNLPKASDGGGSDANLVADRLPVLDGIGAVGGGPHTLEEWIDVTQLVARTALLQRLYLELR
jgi:glutamate carboxypeptidase